MKDDWRPYADAAMVDLTAAHLGTTNDEVRDHLVDAMGNLQRALEALEED